MRILHLVHQYLPDDVGGTELYTRALASELCRRGHDVTLFYRGQGGEERLSHRSEEGVQVWRANLGLISPLRRFWFTFNARQIERAFAQLLDHARPDVVHVQHLMGLPQVLVRMVQRRGIPYVLTLHDYWWICANAQLLTNYDRTICGGPRAFANCARCALARAGRPQLWPLVPPLMGVLGLRNLLLRRVLRGAAAIVAPSDFVRQWYAGRGIAEERLTTISHGLKPPAGLPKRQAHHPLRFAYFGGLSWQKGLHVVVDAFGQLEGAAELWIAGDESFDPGYSRSLRDRATKGVRFLGTLSHAEVWQRLSEVDVVLVPSLWYETFSLLTREAFAVGNPVVVSDLGALAEAVRPGEDGYRVPPGDVGAWRAALQRFVDSPALVEQLRRQIVSPLTLDEHVSRIESLYRMAIVT